MVNVLMVDQESSIKAVKQYLSKSSTNVVIKYEANNGLEALELLKKHQEEIDVILLEPILSKLDGLGFLKEIRKENIDKKVIVYSTYLSDVNIRSLSMYDVSFFLYKDSTMDTLIERIEDSKRLEYLNYEFQNNKLSKTISKLLHDLGMPSHIKGYQYIRDSIELMYYHSDTLGGITKDVYPYVAKKYNTTSSRVERAIRHAIEVSWSRGDYDLMEEIFGHSVDFDRAKPTNSEFLATVTDKITLDEQKEKVRQ